jgi:DNA polymerase-3 subunit delta'
MSSDSPATYVPVGNEANRQHLRRLYLEGRASGSYLFSGMDQVGKKMTALWFARLVSCTGDAPHPCEACISCRKIHQGGHPDVRVVEKREDKKFIVIEQARDEIVQEAAFKPFEGRFRFFLVDDAHALNDQAQNALLKVLEEPGSQVIIVLVTSRPGDLLPTIRSRCREFRFFPLSPREVEEVILSAPPEGLDPVRMKLLSASSYGAPGRALSLAADKGFWKRRESLFGVLEKAPDGRLEDILDFADSYRVSHTDVKVLESTFEIILSWFRDLLFIQKGMGDESILNRDYKDTMSRAAACTDGERVAGIIEIVLEVRRLVFENNLNVKMALQRMLIHVKKAYS